MNTPYSRIMPRQALKFQQFESALIVALQFQFIDQLFDTNKVPVRIQNQILDIYETGLFANILKNKNLLTHLTCDEKKLTDRWMQYLTLNKQRFNKYIEARLSDFTMNHQLASSIETFFTNP